MLKPSQLWPGLIGFGLTDREEPRRYGSHERPSAQMVEVVSIRIETG